jgi:hypothetical protein
LENDESRFLKVIWISRDLSFSFKKSNFKSFDFLYPKLQLLFKWLEFSHDGDDVFLRSLKAQIQYVQFIEKVIKKRNFNPLNASLNLSVSFVSKRKRFLPVKISLVQELFLLRAISLQYDTTSLCDRNL